jgi:hypothetical protein
MGSEVDHAKPLNHRRPAERWAAIAAGVICGLLLAWLIRLRIADPRRPA